MTSETIEVVRGPEETAKITTQFLVRVQKSLDICTATLPASQSRAAREISQIFYDIPRRKGKMRLITNITKDKLKDLKELMNVVEIRHRDDVSVYFAVSESEFLASPRSRVFNSNTTLLYSNEQLFVKHQQEQFQMLWDNAVPAHLRIKELESGHARIETKIIHGEENVMHMVNQFLSRASAAGPNPFAYGVSDMNSSNRAAKDYDETLSLSLERNPDFQILLVTDVQEANLQSIKKLLGANYKIKHLEGNNIRFSVSREEYIETIASNVPGGVPDQILWSNDPQLIAQATRMFNTLWGQARPVQTRINEIESDEPPAITRLIYDPTETKSVYRNLIDKARDEVLLLLPSAFAFHRHESAGLITSLLAIAGRGLSIKILAPLDNDIQTRFSKYLSPEPHKDEKNANPNLNVDTSKSETSLSFSIVSIPPAKTLEGISIAVVDRKSSLVIEELGTSLDFMRATGLSTYTTSPVSVKSNIRFVERMLQSTEIFQQEEEALEGERITRRQAELMRDILIHDIRNYNQITRANVELLQQGLAEERLEQFAKSAIRAIDGSTELIQNAKLLSGIMGEKDWKLQPIDLVESLEKSLALVRGLYPDKVIEVMPKTFPRSTVLADTLLDEVFVNVLSNAVKYTEGRNVQIHIELSQIFQKLDEFDRRRYWRLVVSDHGRGVSDDLKTRAALRYQGRENGKGLGLSIAHGLVTHRYYGRLELKNTDERDYTKGLRVEILLQSA